MTRAVPLVPGKWKLCLMLAAMAAYALPLVAQSGWQPGHEGIGFGKPHGKQWVQLVSSPQISVKIGQRSEAENVSLRFAIDSGLHINSHAPHSKFLIPTILTLGPSADVEIARVEYPPGVDYHLAFDPKEPLSVYTGEFALLVRLHVRPGRHILHGALRYQACDNRACNPPRTLPVTLDIFSQ